MIDNNIGNRNKNFYDKKVSPWSIKNVLIDAQIVSWQ